MGSGVGSGSEYTGAHLHVDREGWQCRKALVRACTLHCCGQTSIARHNLHCIRSLDVGLGVEGVGWEFLDVVMGVEGGWMMEEREYRSPSACGIEKVGNAGRLRQGRALSVAVDRQACTSQLALYITQSWKGVGWRMLEWLMRQRWTESHGREEGCSVV